jgi:hypothetical protein
MAAAVTESATSIVAANTILRVGKLQLMNVGSPDGERRRADPEIELPVPKERVIVA